MTEWPVRAIRVLYSDEWMKMGEMIEMRRFFDDADREIQGAFTAEAKAYGPGAFSWDTDANGVRWLLLRYPDKVFRNSDGESVSAHAFPVYRAGEERLPGKFRSQWEWDGDEERPTLTLSLAVKTNRGDHDDWVESFHGFVKGGRLEVL